MQYGLAMKRQEIDTDPPLAAEIVVNVKIVSSDGTVHFDHNYSGMSNESYRLSDIAANPDLQGRLYQRAIDSLADFLGKQLAFRYDDDSLYRVN
jgi:hypothetical protein